MGQLSPASATPSVQCTFTMPGCDHGDIFHDEYVRTNRTNHTKIMRCFPHCCPGHRARSYCGSPLHVKLQSSTTPQEDSKLVVYARFRPAHLPALANGDRVSLKTIEASLQSADPSKGEWIESRLSRFHDEPLLFEINPSSRWYYPWSGAATIAMRSTDHVFEAIVFYHISTTELEVVAQTASPNFGLKSFRRSSTQTTKAVTKSEAASPKSSPKRKAITRAASPTDAGVSPAPQHHQRRPVSPEQSKFISTSMSSTTSSPLRSQFPLEAKPSVFHTAYVPQHGHHQAFQLPAIPVPQSFHSTREYSTPSSPMQPTLNAITQWLHELPAASVGSRSMLAWQQMVVDACEAQVVASREVPSVRAGLVPILSALDIAVRGRSPMRSSSLLTPPAMAASPLDTMDAAVRVLLHEWLDVESTRASSSRVERFVRMGLSSNRAELEAAHADWLADVTSRAQQYVEGNTRSSWSQLMSTTSRFTARRPQSRAASNTAGGVDSSEFGYRSFVALCRERYLGQHQRHKQQKKQRLARDSYPRKRQRTMVTSSSGISSNISQQASELPPGLHHSARVWVSRMEDVSIEMDGVAQQSLSLLTVVQFWRHLSCVRLDYSGAQLCVASVFNASSGGDRSCTKLTLDGQYRWFSSLPSGEPTTGTTLMGYVVGDYVGRTTSAGTIHFTTYLWPSKTTSSSSGLLGASASASASAYAWHWTIDAMSLSVGSSSTVVSVVVESAEVVRCPYAMETMSLSEKLQCVGRWQHACEARLAYHRAAH